MGTLIAEKRFPKAIEETRHPPSLLAGKILIVTHADQQYDEYLIAKTGIDRVIRSFRADPRATVLFLKERFTQDASQGASWYTDNRDPDYALPSQNGELHVPVLSNDVTIVGGFLGACHYQTTLNVIRWHLSQGPLTLRYPLDAIYIGFGTPYKSLDRLYSILNNKGELAKYLLETMSYKPERKRIFVATNQGGFDLVNDYAFQIRLDGKTLASLGTGSKLVRIEVTSP